jgi:hypothetical protein
MKATKLIALIAFAGFGLCTEGVFAQSTDNSMEAPPIATEESASGTESEPYNEKVTIDAASAESTESSGGTVAAPEEKKERLRVYSGKHDGVNVIVDPR